MPNGKGGSQEDRELERIRERIKKLENFKDLKPEEYALPRGIADILAKNENKMKTAQLRKFFAKIKNIENKLRGKKDLDTLDEKVKNEMYMIVPELTYAWGRDLIDKYFFCIVTTIIPDQIKSVEDFKNFSRFMSALVAYRKVEESRRGQR
jgi:CRISPR type III-A-associated protein Csm2